MDLLHKTDQGHLILKSDAIFYIEKIGGIFFVVISRQMVFLECEIDRSPIRQQKQQANKRSVTDP